MYPLNSRVMKTKYLFCLHLNAAHANHSHFLLAPSSVYFRFKKSEIKHIWKAKLNVEKLLLVSDNLFGDIISYSASFPSDFSLNFQIIYWWKNKQKLYPEWLKPVRWVKKINLQAETSKRLLVPLKALGNSCTTCEDLNFHQLSPLLSDHLFFLEDGPQGPS